MKKVILSAIAVIALSGTFSDRASATTLTNIFSSFWVLGDSLSDNGNLFRTTGNPPPPYYEGRFSNGPVWNESIIAEFTVAGQPAVGSPPVGGPYNGNFAYGGARTSGPNLNGPIPGLDEQVGLYALTAAPISGSNPLVSVWAGANNIFQTIAVAGDAILAAEAAADDILASVLALSSFGVGDVLMFNLPDIGQSPSYLGTDDQGIATAATNAFNAQLEFNISALELAGVNIIDIDVNQIFADLRSDPSAIGLTNITDSCLANFLICDPDTWAFWDDVHPTERVHAFINDVVRARIAEDMITAVPLPASGLLLVFGLGAFVVARRRQAG